MKKNFFKSLLPLFLIIPSLFNCMKNDPIYDDFEDSYVDKLPSNTQDGLTFHAFNWTFNQIKENLNGIFNSGFKNILTMPVQQPKNGGSTWWSYYQPLSFSIADNSTIGTKEELKELCDEAEKYGISILVDIVANHMANLSDDDLEIDGTPKVSPSVEQYEPILYKNRNSNADGIHGVTFHHNKNASGCGQETQYYQYGQLPDLNTSNPYVQERVLSLLKECIDVGVDGFRFDTAKHIETEDDPQYASDFWVNTLDVAKVYYNEKTGKELYSYGEILGSPLERSIHLYTKRMLVTDDGYTDQFLVSTLNGNATKILNATYKIDNPKNEIAWVESHDEYVTTSSHISDARVSKLWAVIASRKDLGGLYLARPNEDLTVGTIGSYYFENEYVACANRFHNRFVGTNEYLSANDTIFVNERISSNDQGAFILCCGDVNSNKEIEVKLEHLENGNYYDTLTGNKFIVTDGKAKIKFSNIGMVFLVRSNKSAHPRLTISERSGSFVNDKIIKINISYFEEAYYTFNDESKKYNLEKETEISLKDNILDDGLVKLNIYVRNGDFIVQKSFIYTKIELIEGYFNVINLNSKYLTEYELYIWSWSPNKWSKDYEVRDDRLLINTDGMTGFLLAIFKRGYVVTNSGVWDNNVIKQSVDIKGSTLKDNFYDASNF